MGNINRATGFRPIKPKNGVGVPSLVIMQATLDRSGDATGNHGDIYVGDPVTLSSGKVIVANSNTSLLGVVVAVGKISPENAEAQNFFNIDVPGQQYAPLTDTTNTYNILIARANDWIFEGQAALALNYLPGSYADITTTAATAHGSQTTSNSSAGLTTASNNDVIIVENNQMLDNTVNAVYNKFRFEFVKLQIL